MHEQQCSLASLACACRLFSSPAEVDTMQYVSADILTDAPPSRTSWDSRTSRDSSRHESKDDTRAESRVDSRVGSRIPSEAPTNPGNTLYDKLGGPEALEAAVDLFYDKVLADEKLKGFFEGTNMMRLVIKQVLHNQCPSPHPPLHAPFLWC